MALACAGAMRSRNKMLCALSNSQALRAEDDLLDADICWVREEIIAVLKGRLFVRVFNLELIGAADD